MINKLYFDQKILGSHATSLQNTHTILTFHHSKVNMQLLLFFDTFGFAKKKNVGTTNFTQTSLEYNPCIDTS